MFKLFDFHAVLLHRSVYFWHILLTQHELFDRFNAFISARSVTSTTAGFVVRRPSHGDLM